MGWRARKGTKVTDNACTVHCVYPDLTRQQKDKLVQTETEGSVDGVSVRGSKSVHRRARIEKAWLSGWSVADSVGTLGGGSASPQSADWQDCKATNLLHYIH